MLQFACYHLANERLLSNIPCLALTPHDIDNFYDNHEEFVQQAMQIVERDVKIAGMGMAEEE